MAAWYNRACGEITASFAVISPQARLYQAAMRDFPVK
jgi:hypothetical protein